MKPVLLAAAVVGLAGSVAGQTSPGQGQTQRFPEMDRPLYLNRLHAAEQSAREVVKLDSDQSIPRARYVLGAVLIEKKDYAGAAEQLRTYVEIAEPGPDVERAKQMLAQLEAKLGADSHPAP